jgi:hypothetical protein
MEEEFGQKKRTGSRTTKTSQGIYVSAFERVEATVKEGWQKSCEKGVR